MNIGRHLLDESLELRVAVAGDGSCMRAVDGSGWMLAVDGGDVNVEVVPMVDIGVGFFFEGVCEPQEIHVILF